MDKKYIKNIINNIFTNLGTSDIDKLTDSTFELVNEISFHLFDFINNGKMLLLFPNVKPEENTKLTIKNIVLLLLPVISKFDFYDLNQIIYFLHLNYINLL